jgi:pimeloyl-ACP methyl ester carboxylesterase
MRSQIAQTSKGPIEYVLIGHGPVLLLCHGTSSNCYSTDAFQSLAAAGFCLLSPSRPGYGRTPLDAGRSNAQAAQALIALLDCLQIETCSVIAVSGGGPTGIALAAMFPQRIERLILLAGVTRPESRPDEPAYKTQMAFYGPLHRVQWSLLRMISNMSPRGMARQTMAIFSTHDPDDALSRLSPEGIGAIQRFYQGQSSRLGALNDATHVVGEKLLQAIAVPALVVHSREDGSVPFSHAEWALQHIPQATLCEAGCTGHFIWVDPCYGNLLTQMTAFLHAGALEQTND